MINSKRNSIRKVLHKNQNNAISNKPLSNFDSKEVTFLSNYENSNSITLKTKKEKKLYTVTSPEILPVCNDINQINSMLTSVSPKLCVKLIKTRANTMCSITEPKKSHLLNCNKNLPLTVDVNCLFCNNNPSLITAPSGCFNAQIKGDNLILPNHSYSVFYFKF